MAIGYLWADDNTRVRADECLHCIRCRDVLFPGSDYYDIGGEVYCEDCFSALESSWKKVVGE